MKQLLFFCLFVFSIIQFSCSKIEPDLDYEKSVAYEIFPLLIERIHFDRRSYPPPPPTPIFDKNGEIIGYDTIKSTEILKKWKKKDEELYQDSVKLVVAIIDSTEILRFSDIKFFIEREVADNIIFKKVELSKKYQINLNRLVADQKLKFRYRSEFPEKSNIWYVNEGFHLSGIVGFSRILFDQSKQYGILSAGFGCGKLCGTGYLVLIKKVDDKWLIEKMLITTEA